MQTVVRQDIEASVKEWGRELGFDAIAVAGTELAPEVEGVAGLEARGQRGPQRECGRLVGKIGVQR